MISRLIIALAFVVLISKTSEATSINCIGKIYEYGLNFDLTKINNAIVTKKWKTKNPHVSEDTIQWKNIKWNYGLATTRECITCSPKIGITELFLAADQTTLPCGLNRGMLMDDISQLMGEPDKRTKDELIYLYPPFDKNNEIDFQFQKGNLWRVKWKFYSD